MIAIIDYGVGNLFSLRSSFAAIGQEAVVTNNIEEIRRADRLLLPGVGAFQDAAEKLRASGMDKAVTEEAAKGKPLLGVCLGVPNYLSSLFLLRSLSEVPAMAAYPVYSLGAVAVVALFSFLLFGERPDRREMRALADYVYFVHSYSAVNCEESLLAVTEYGAELTACVGKGNVFGCQFHPEKSGEVGLRILKAFCETEGMA